MSGNPYNMSINLNGEILCILMDDLDFRNEAWTIDITNAVTGENVAKHVLTGNYASINTTDWKRGFYIVRVIIDKEIITEKIQIK